MAEEEVEACYHTASWETLPPYLFAQAHIAFRSLADTPNSLLAAQPLVVTGLSQKTLNADATFLAPPTPGVYALRVHIMSAFVVGVELEHDLEFTVE